MPAVLRSYPFSLARIEGREQPIVCVDEDSGLLVEETAPNAEKFFDADGRPSPTTNWITDILHRIEQDQAATNLAVAALTEARVIRPWDLNIPVGKQQVTVNALHQIDETALNRLEDETFLKVRKASGLLVAYAQLLSMAQVNVLARLSISFSNNCSNLAKDRLRRYYLNDIGTVLALNFFIPALRENTRAEPERRE